MQNQPDTVKILLSRFSGAFILHFCPVTVRDVLCPS